MEETLGLLIWLWMCSRRKGKSKLNSDVVFESHWLGEDKLLKVEKGPE